MLTEIAPDGGATDGYHNLHMWMPMPLRKAGNYIIYPAGTDSWISGIAFGKNLWGHARNSAKAYM